MKLIQQKIPFSRFCIKASSWHNDSLLVLIKLNGPPLPQISFIQFFTIYSLNVYVTVISNANICVPCRSYLYYAVIRLWQNSISISIFMMVNGHMWGERDQGGMLYRPLKWMVTCSSQRARKTYIAGHDGEWPHMWWPGDQGDILHVRSIKALQVDDLRLAAN